MCVYLQRCYGEREGRESERVVSNLRAVISTRCSIGAEARIYYNGVWGGQVKTEIVIPNRFRFSTICPALWLRYCPDKIR